MPLIGQKLMKLIKLTQLTNDPLVEYLWAFVQMKMEDHYKNMKDANYKKKKTAKIFILDTGVDSNHEDISANFFSTDKKYDTDANGHGTHCAGIANAVSNNSLGIASYCPKNDYMQVTSIKVLGDNGGGTQESIIDGIILAADEGADVISMSLGGRAVDSRERAYNAAIAYATRAGAIVVVAAGNSNSDAQQYVPACCDGVIAVSAVDPNLDKASFSNYVNNIAMKVAAPGVNIYSTFPNNQYKVLNGTSMATPYVAGLLGMMKSLNPKLTAKEAYSILEQTGIETGDTPATGKFIQPATSIRMVSKN